MPPVRKMVELGNFNEFDIRSDFQIVENPCFHVGRGGSVHLVQSDFERIVPAFKCSCTTTRLDVLFNHKYFLSFPGQLCTGGKSSKSGSDYYNIIMHKCQFLKSGIGCLLNSFVRSKRYLYVL